MSTFSERNGICQKNSKGIRPHRMETLTVLSNGKEIKSCKDCGYVPVRLPHFAGEIKK